jgi:DNA invertase Pin-like site-specific DNA recombinase
MALVGYARVSTADQSLSVQLDLLRKAGATAIFSETFSTKKGVSRAELDKCLASLKAGDTLLVVRLDRLARSILDLWGVLKDLEARRVGFRCLAQASVDTTTPIGRFTTTILGAVAELERDLIDERRTEGIEHARREGKYIRPQFQAHMKVARDLRAQNLNVTEICRRMNEMGLATSRRSIYRMTAGQWKESA